MVSVEKFFLRYAFPCAHVLVGCNKLSLVEHDKLISDFKSGILPSRSFIEGCFVAAFRRLKKLSSEMNLGVWDMNVMEEYWHRGHNKNIDDKEGGYSSFPDVFCDFCKTRIAEVIEFLDGGFVLVSYGSVKRPVNKEFFPDVKVGDKVWVHHAHICELV